jgi:hypothetical protein
MTDHRQIAASLAFDLLERLNKPEPTDEDDVQIDEFETSGLLSHIAHTLGTAVAEFMIDDIYELMAIEENMNAPPELAA